MSKGIAMRIKELKNISSISITLLESDGNQCIVPPGNTVRNKNVKNIPDLSGKVIVTYDLGEVNECNCKTRLFD